MRSGKRKNHAAFYGAVVAVSGALASGCKTGSCELQHWTIEVSLINGSYPSSFWLQSQERNPSALSWWHTPSFESISDTIHSENGQPCEFYGPIDLSEVQFIGEWRFYDHDSILHPLEHQCLISGDTIKLILASPFWIELIGGRNILETSQDEPVFVECDWCTKSTDNQAAVWFTPGRMPKPALILEGWIHPHQSLPLTRSIELRTADDELLSTRPISIRTGQICDTLSLPYLR